ncbi:hypothetical protein AGR13a_Cc290022 [Agrobacterium genomosp. 13 str. CFBP 6927]|uniref:Transposase n=1 Tax=Agrobacterium genomosp. 13 str. CFBP 6927 TaxID=1183428 RepID=A0ABP2BIZ1_9HYPH|nr:hypothetical protein AGR13a_Cc290022 [Agrobacterium genomosp. 13 str. CFBP 6927]
MQCKNYAEAVVKIFQRPRVLKKKRFLSFSL